MAPEPAVASAGVIQHELRKELLPALSAGALTALVALAYAGSFAGLVFGGGELMPHSGRALLAALIGGIAGLLVMGWRSGFSFSVAGPEANPSAILAVTLATLAHEIVESAGTDAAELLPTIMGFLCLSTLGCGVATWLIGRVHGGRYVRYVPHAVIGGFLAGTGWLLISGACRMLTGETPGVKAAHRLVELPPITWATALIVATVLTVLVKRVQHFLVVPTVIAVSIAAFHLMRVAMGIDIATARAEGLLLAPLRLGEWTHAANLPYASIRWDLVASHGHDFAAMTAVVVITLLLNATSLDVATGNDADFDRELKAIGATNVVAGFAGGMVAVLSFNRSLLHRQAGGQSRWAAISAAGFILAAMLLAPGIVGWIPRPVLTGLILHIGIALAWTWVWESRNRLPRSEYFAVIAILGIVAVAGVVMGVLLGLMVACLNFVYTFSRTPPVKYAFAGGRRRSSVERTPGESEELRRDGARMQGLALQGFLFFGTASTIYDRVRDLPVDTRQLVVDFRLVQGVDSSAVAILRKMVRRSRDHAISVAFTEVPAPVAATLLHGGLDLANEPGLRVFSDLDHALEWGEEEILAEARKAPSPTCATDAPGNIDVLASEELAMLSRHLPRRRLAAHESLIREGEASDALYIVLSGRVSVQLHRLAGLPSHTSAPDSPWMATPEAQAGGQVKRLHTYGPGTVVGEMGFYTGETRSADIVADEDTEVLHLTRTLLDELESTRPELARTLHHFVVRTLAGRLRAANDEIRTLLE